MNSRLFLFFILITFSSCGLKKKPIAPSHSALPSIPSSYSVQIKKNIEPDKKEDENKKDNQKKNP